jgi:hypothetical protein
MKVPTPYTLLFKFQTILYNVLVQIVDKEPELNVLGRAVSITYEHLLS